jgi:hypothetical protein
MKIRLSHYNPDIIKVSRVLFSVCIAAVFILLNSCSNSTEPDELPDVFFEVPAVTGMIITGKEGPEELAIWRHPLYPAGVEYPISGNTTSKILADVHPIPGSNVMDLENPYPNPSNGTVKIIFKVAIETRVSVWMLKGRLPEENPNGFENGSGGIFVSPNNETTVVLLDKYLLRPGEYLIDYNGKIEDKYIPSGFYRVYFKADNHLFWRDILIALKKSDVPPDLFKYFTIIE